MGGQGLVIGATNRKILLDEAVLRPGRFDRSIYMGRPSVSNRVKILQVLLNSISAAFMTIHDPLASWQIIHVSLGLPKPHASTRPARKPH